LGVILEKPFKIKNQNNYLMKNIDDGVKNRLIKFLLKDKLGIRKSLLRLFAEVKSCNTVEIYHYLLKQGFNVNYRAVSSMVGQMHSRLGILRFNLTYEHNVYTLKEDYLGIVKLVLNPFSNRDSKAGHA
jgi:hypothetical protein